MGRGLARKGLGTVSKRPLSCVLDSLSVVSSMLGTLAKQWNTAKKCQTPSPVPPLTEAGIHCAVSF